MGYTVRCSILKAADRFSFFSSLQLWGVNLWFQHPPSLPHLWECRILCVRSGFRCGTTCERTSLARNAYQSSSIFLPFCNTLCQICFLYYVQHALWGRLLVFFTFSCLFASLSRNSSLHLIPNLTTPATMSTLHTAQIASGGWLRCGRSNRRCFKINRRGFLRTQGEVRNQWVRLLVCFSSEKWRRKGWMSKAGLWSVFRSGCTPLMSCSGPKITRPLLKRLLQKVLTALSHVPICKAGLASQISML